MDGLQNIIVLQQEAETLTNIIKTNLQCK